MHKKPLVLLFFSVITLTQYGCSSTPPPKPDLAASYNAKLGAEYIRRGRMKLANEKLKKALEQNPGSAEANHYYALLQEQLGNIGQADRYFVKALYRDRDNPEIHNNYGAYLCRQKKFKAAEKHFAKATADPLYATPEYAMTNAGVCAHDAGQLEKAENYLRSALKKSPNFPSALYAMSKLAYDRRDYSRAQAFLYRYNEVAGKNAKSLALCKSINLGLGEPAEAAKCSKELLIRFPDSKEALSLK